MKKSQLKKVNWIAAMSVGVEEIDEQHKKFLDMANEAIDAVAANNHNVINKIIDQFKDYASYHFKTEADLMAKYKYPESSHHHDAHIDFYDKVADLESSVSDTKEAELISFIQSWLLLHIGSTDKKLGAFINNRKGYL